MNFWVRVYGFTCIGGGLLLMGVATFWLPVMLILFGIAFLIADKKFYFGD